MPFKEKFHILSHPSVSDQGYAIENILVDILYRNTTLTSHLMRQVNITVFNVLDPGINNWYSLREFKLYSVLVSLNEWLGVITNSKFDLVVSGI